jgi:hypothetical protein
MNDMDASAKEEPDDEGSDASQESTEQTAQRKVRDLKPEKDPMGAGDLRAEDSATTR